MPTRLCDLSFSSHPFHFSQLAETICSSVRLLIKVRILSRHLQSALEVREVSMDLLAELTQTSLRGFSECVFTQRDVS